MNKMHDLTGKRFGKLTAIEPVREYGKALRWVCMCDCGNKITPYASSLKSGHTQSCGCLKKGEAGRRNGVSHTRLYRCWQYMKSKCSYVKNRAFSGNGGRGIIVCEEWNDSFESFKKWAMSNGYEDGLTLLRKDTDGDYCPENCYWGKSKK